MSDPSNEAARLINKSSAYRLKGDFTTALQLAQKALDIADEIGNLSLKSACYTSIGNIYWGNYNYGEAIRNHQKALEIDEQMGDDADKAKDLLNLGLIKQEMEQYNEGIINLTKSLYLARQLGLKSTEAACLMGIGMCQKELGNKKKARKLYLQAEEIFRDIGERHYIEAVKKHLNEL